MYILSLSIHEFAGLRDFSLDLSEGLNLITGRNESGKSTLIAFIRFILYGLPKRRAGEVLSDGDRAFSWENGVADGSMTVKKDGTVYRIERREQSGSSRRLLHIIDESTGELLPKGVTPESLLLGFPAEVFDSTACLRQLRMGELDSDGLSGAIENLILSGDESINTERVLKNLDKARTVLLHKNGRGGEIYRTETEISSLRLSLDREREDHRAKREAEEERTVLQKRIGETARALERAEEECTSLAETEVLTRFDSLHGEEKRLGALEEELLVYEKAHPISSASLPALCRSLLDAAERLDAHERGVLRCEAEERIASETPAAGAEILRAAEAVRASGGADAAVRRLTAYTRARRQARVTATVLFSIGGACLLLGAALALVLTEPILSLVSLGGVVGFFGIPFVRRAKRADRDAAALYASLGVDPTEDLRSALDRIEKEAKRDEARKARVKAAESALADARRRESEQRSAAAELLLSVGISSSGASVTPQTLRARASDLTRENAERERLKSGVALLSESVSRMKETLLPYSEPILRERLPAGFDYADPAALHAYESKRDRLSEELRALRESLHATERRIAALTAASGDPEALLSEINEKCEEKAALERKHRAVVLAYESISAAREGLKHRIGPRLRSDASRYLAVISDGKYDTMSYDTSFTLSGEENGRTRPSAAFSGGTQDAMYLSLRLALSDLLASGGEPLPLLLDEALAQLDDTRAESLLSILCARAEEHGGQVILFTCHTREAEMLKDSGARMITL